MVPAPKHQDVSGLGGLWEQASQASTALGPVKAAKVVLGPVLPWIEADCLCPASYGLRLQAVPCQAVSSAQAPGGSILPKQA